MAALVVDREPRRTISRDRAAQFQTHETVHAATAMTAGAKASSCTFVRPNTRVCRHRSPQEEITRDVILAQ
ncbi:hypothetical protein HNR11_000258 [Nesterenkonia sandarakina]|uniref:Uncharacterized protein n=1 Tax=Nesterenkonia sandarakina TaxID=272918 RepID=A0A7Z0J2D4_9MICC|nr:hypothetical protein [Nesterenkonia sandarakina]